MTYQDYCPFNLINLGSKLGPGTKGISSNLLPCPAGYTISFTHTGFNGF